MIGSYKVILGGDATKPILIQQTAEIAVIPHVVNTWGKQTLTTNIENMLKD